MEIREITENDLNALMELYIQLSPTNIGLSDEKKEIIWSEIQKNKNRNYAKNCANNYSNNTN